jgi:hypothetical protein
MKPFIRVLSLYLIALTETNLKKDFVMNPVYYLSAHTLQSLCQQYRDRLVQIAVQQAGNNPTTTELTTKKRERLPHLPGSDTSPTSTPQKPTPDISDFSAFSYVFKPPSIMADGTVTFSMPYSFEAMSGVTPSTAGGGTVTLPVGHITVLGNQLTQEEGGPPVEHGQRPTSLPTVFENGSIFNPVKSENVWVAT